MTLAEGVRERVLLVEGVGTKLGETVREGDGDGVLVPVFEAEAEAEAELEAEAEGEGEGYSLGMAVTVGNLPRFSPIKETV